MYDEEKAKQALKDDIKNYSSLKAINKSEEFNTFFDLQIKTVAHKMMSLFTGNGPKDWDEFCRIRGEVIAALYPIQEVRGAESMIKHLTEQLNQLYNTTS